MSEDRKELKDISSKTMVHHLVQISSAITDARKDLHEQGMTWMNAEIYQQLNRAQSGIDSIRSAIRASKKYKTIDGGVVHGYTLVSYQIKNQYYGLPSFGHIDCAKEEEPFLYPPLEEHSKFFRDTPEDGICAGCGKRLLPEVE